MRKAIASFGSLTPADKVVLWRAWWLLWVVDIGLRVRPLAKLHAALGRGLPAARDVENPAQLAWETWWLVDAAARHHLVKMSCLRRSLVLQRLLAEQGLAVGVYVGARKEQGQMRAHAWIEVAGEAIGEGQGVVEAFVPVLRL